MLIGRGTPQAAQESPADAAALVGRLATVEPSSRRVTILPEGEADLMEMFVAAEGEVRRDNETLTLADLVIQVGRRVSVHYRVDGPRRVVQRIIVEPD